MNEPMIEKCMKVFPFLQSLCKIKRMLWYLGISLLTYP
jgi:hypothetical protein